MGSGFREGKETRETRRIHRQKNVGLPQAEIWLRSLCSAQQRSSVLKLLGSAMERLAEKEGSEGRGERNNSSKIGGAQIDTELQPACAGRSEQVSVREVLG